MADGVAAALLGWVLLVRVIGQVNPDASRLEKEILLIGFSGLCSLAGLLLVDVVSYLEKRVASIRTVVAAFRFFTAAAVGSFLLTYFQEGCFAALAVMFFILFLALVFRSLAEPIRERPPAPPEEGIEAARTTEVETSYQESHHSSVLAAGARTKLDRLLAMILSGIATGFLVGFARYFLDRADMEARVLDSRLLSPSIVISAVALRFLVAWIVQGSSHLRGWKAALIGLEGLLTGVLLASFMTSPKMPFSVDFQHLLERHGVSWILAGILLGLTFGLLSAFVSIIIGEGFKAYLFGASAEIPVGVDTQPALLGSGVGTPLSGTSKGMGGGSDPNSPGMPTQAGPSIARRGCSCLVAPAIFVAAFAFLMIHELVYKPLFPSKGPPKTKVDLPAGCPQSCESITLDNFDLSGVDLSRSNFAGTKFPGVVLVGTNLREANLKGASLFWADMRDADLSGADLSNADLRRAILLGARLEGANLRGAYLRKAALQDLDLSTAEIEGVDLEDASYSEGTKWPADFDPTAARMYLVRVKP